jgi:subtilisin family serine protease
MTGWSSLRRGALGRLRRHAAPVARALSMSFVLACGGLSAARAGDDAHSLPAPALASTPASASSDAGTPVASRSHAAASLQVLLMLRSPPAHARIDGGYGAGYGDAARTQSQARIGARIASAHGFQVVTQWPMPSLGMDCVVLSLPSGATLATAIAALQSHSEVAWAQPMNEFQAQGHADPLYALQPAAAQWHLDDLHAIATGRHVRIALVDSGVDDAHPDLAQAIETHANFVDGQTYVAELHGTAVAGLIAARGDNGIGMVGIAPDAQLLALRACWEVNARQTLCNSLSLAKALNFAIEHHAEIINMSLSGPSDLLLGRLIDVALSRRQQVVAAVDAHAEGGGFPAAHPGVIAVADALVEAPLAGLPGMWTAPADDLPTTVPGGGWRLVSGTSFAAGQVSGLLAVIDQARADAQTRGLGRSGEAKPTLVRLPGGGIDACASLVRATTPAPSSGWRPGAASDCPAVLATIGGTPGR